MLAVIKLSIAGGCIYLIYLLCGNSLKRGPFNLFADSQSSESKEPEILPFFLKFLDDANELLFAIGKPQLLWNLFNMLALLSFIIYSYSQLYSIENKTSTLERMLAENNELIDRKFGNLMDMVRGQDEKVIQALDEILLSDNLNSKASDEDDQEKSAAGISDEVDQKASPRTEDSFMTLIVSQSGNQATSRSPESGDFLTDFRESYRNDSFFDQLSRDLAALKTPEIVSGKNKESESACSTMGQATPVKDLFSNSEENKRTDKSPSDVPPQKIPLGPKKQEDLIFRRGKDFRKQNMTANSSVKQDSSDFSDSDTGGSDILEIPELKTRGLVRYSKDTIACFSESSIEKRRMDKGKINVEIKRAKYLTKNSKIDVCFSTSSLHLDNKSNTKMNRDSVLRRKEFSENSSSCSDFVAISNVEKNTWATDESEAESEVYYPCPTFSRTPR